MGDNPWPDLSRRLRAAALRARVFPELRELVALPREADLSERQWSALASTLQGERARLLRKVALAQRLLQRGRSADDARRVNALLGEIELALSQSFVFFDTYVDVLTQRASARLGPLMAGCDMLARDALKRPHPLLAASADPLVYCDRGFGASMLRAGVRFPGGARNPVPLIQIPYEKLHRKYTLSSIYHEAGHEATVRLGLQRELQALLRRAVLDAGGSGTQADLFALWSNEIGPDFWAFCGCGPAQALGARDILALPPANVFRIGAGDPHPPPYLRVRLAFEWCRQQWGPGDWDAHDRDWQLLYPLHALSRATRRFFEHTAALLPAVATALRGGALHALGGRPIAALFDLDALAPAQLEAAGSEVKRGRLDFRQLAPGAQLAVFRWVRDRSLLDEAATDRVMTRWLHKLSDMRRQHP